MTPDVPPIYRTFRAAWTVLHLVLLVVAIVFALRWALTDQHAKRWYDSATNDLLHVQHTIGNSVRWPWGNG